MRSMVFLPGESFIEANPGGYRVSGGGKILLPLLNRIESEGLVKRYGDFRVKV